MKERERKRVCEAFNTIEQRLADETIESWRAQMPDFWDQLDGLREFLEGKKMICPEN
ncbi:MAG: hypothetical protein ACRD38_06600 [Nitrososphaerales archaeon]